MNNDAIDNNDLNIEIDLNKKIDHLTDKLSQKIDQLANIEEEISNSSKSSANKPQLKKIKVKNEESLTTQTLNNLVSDPKCADIITEYANARLAQLSEKTLNQFKVLKNDLNIMISQNKVKILTLTTVLPNNYSKGNKRMIKKELIAQDSITEITLMFKLNLNSGSKVNATVINT